MAVHYDDLPQFERVKRPPNPPENPVESSKETEKPSEKPVEQQNEKAAENQSQSEKTTQNQPPKRENDLFVASEEKQTRNEMNPHKKSLNDSLSHSLNFGLNDRLVFIKHLFEGSSTDFERVISQLNTIQNFSEAKTFIEQKVKPDYSWENEEIYETRFLNALEKRMG